MSTPPVYPAAGCWSVRLIVCCVCGLLWACTGMNAVAAVPPDLRAIHPEQREGPSPVGGCEVSVNPPPLLWPVSSNRTAQYIVRLSQDADFGSDSTIQVSGLRWALFNAHQQLAPGRWYWQVGTARQPGAAAAWSDQYSFVVTDRARTFATPPASQLLASIPHAHPRILVAAGNLRRLRERLQDTTALATYTRAAERLIDRPLPAEEAALAKQQGQSQFEAKNFAKWASKAYAGRLVGEIRTACVAYVAAGDARFAHEAIRRGMLVASFDIRGATARQVSDFADGSCMEALALVYDCCYDQLNDDQRKQLRDALLARAAPWFSRQINSLESRIFNAHIWQHILEQALFVALALHGEAPEAEQWLTYLYELWIARVPLLGGSDGGWANGINYFGTNFTTLVEVPTLLQRYSGADFFDHPWYHNTTLYQIYVWPPGSASDGFGDGAERSAAPTGGRAMFAYVLGRRFQDPVALWYARQVAGKQDLETLLSPLLRFQQLLEPQSTPPPAAALPDQLAQSRAFRDVGIVTMHTCLADPRENLMLAFRSSPFGSFNHMHSDQNSVNVNVGGQRLLAGSGYYIAYGDQHFRDWYTHTRGHNSVLIDDQGQVRGAPGYGWIPRYLHGQQITYCAGDASHAYGDTGLTRFRRHVALLRPNIIVIYDDLAADHAAKWSWLLHSPGTMTVVDPDRQLRAATAQASADIQLWASAPLRITLSDQFDPPAVNWRNKSSGGTPLDYPNQWHATVLPQLKSEVARFLTVCRFAHGAEPSDVSITRTSSDTLRVGDWLVTAALAADSEPMLRIARGDGAAALAVDGPAFTLGGQQYPAQDAAALLIEQHGALQLRCQDELPEAARR